MGDGSDAYAYWPGVHPDILTVAEPPDTSASDATSFITCWPELPATQILPSEVTVSGAAPTRNCMPTQPLYWLRSGAFNACEVTNGVDEVTPGAGMAGGFSISVTAPGRNVAPTAWLSTVMRFRRR